MSKSSARRTRRVFSAEFKAKVALAALREGNPPLEPRGLEVEFFPKEEVLHEKVKIYR